MEYAAKGTLFQVEDQTTPDVYNSVAQVRNLTPPNMSADILDVSSHDNVSSENSFRTKIPGMKDGGEVTLEMLFDPTEDSQTVLFEALKNDTKLNCHIVFPDTAKTTWAFSAYVSGIEADAPFEDTLSASVTLAVTGEPEFDWTASPRKKEAA
jgi:hypothetical protein